MINVATDRGADLWPWLGVVVLTIAGAVVGIVIDERRNRPRPAADDRPRLGPLAKGGPGQTSSGISGVSLNIGGNGEGIKIKTGSVGGAVVITAALVVLAAALLASRPSTRDAAGADPGKPAAPAWVASANLYDCRSGWVVPDTGRSSIPMLDTPPAGAVMGSGASVDVTIQGVSDEAAVLHSISVEVLRRGPELHGIYLPMLCASDVMPRFYATDLSKPSPTVVPAAGIDSGEKIPAKAFSYKVGKDDVEKIVVTPTVAREYVEWVIHVKWSSGARQGDLRIDDHGRPFRTTATGSTAHWCTDSQDRPWWHPPVKPSQCQ